MRRLLAAAVLILVAAPARPAGEGAAIGHSLEGRGIASRIVALPGDVPAAERPRLLVVAGLQGDHEVGIAVAGALPDALLRAAEDDARLADLLSRFSVEVIPLANPDGRHALAAGPRREFRTNVRPVDADRDGKTDEDGPDDLDRDGRITRMRVPDPAGEWRESDEDPRLLVKADPAKGERGRWRLLPEALDDDGDGEFAEDPFGGVDLDRNFPHGWKEHEPETGTSCPSEPESRALADHLLANPRICTILVYGRRDNLAKAPPADGSQGRTAPTGPLGGDLPLFAEASRRFREIATPHGGDDDPADGGFHQWAYAQRGLPAFATKLLSPPGGDLELPSGKKAETDEGRWLAWSDRHPDRRGFVPWTAFDHPQLGPVEIGGLDPTLGLSAPPDRVDELVREQVKFVTELLALQPAPAWEGVTAERKAGELWEVSASLVNDGFFPVVTEMGERTRAVLPVRVTIGAAEDRLLQGRSRELVARLGARGASKTFRWLVRAAAGDEIRLRAVTPHSGTVEATIRLEDR